MIHKPYMLLFLFALWPPQLIGCGDIVPSTPEDSELLDGPLEGLNQTQTSLFVEGDEIFGTTFAFTDGVGPIFHAQSCNTCHPGEGRGHPEIGFTRFGRMTATGFDPMHHQGGPQLQDRAAPHFTPESLPREATGVSTFLPPPVTGLGFVNTLNDQTFFELADPNDKDSNGISGRVSMVEATPDVLAALDGAYSNNGQRFQQYNGKVIGRFGRKAANVSLRHQTAVAFRDDMGLTNDILLSDPINHHIGAGSSDEHDDPEIGSATLSAVVFYLKTLRAPVRRNTSDPAVIKGEELFGSLGCTGCHTPSLTTGASRIEALHQKTFHPYSDFLLHDMGEALNDGYTEGNATTAEWRTPPLWGLGLAEQAQGGQVFLLHDGRARSIDEAIRFHGGEAQASSDQYTSLSDKERQALIRFLESL